MSHNYSPICLFILIVCLSVFTCQNQTSEYEEATKINYEFVISSIQENTINLWQYGVRRSANIIIRQPEIVNRIDETLGKLHSTSDKLLSMLSVDKLDCDIFKSEIDNSHELILNVFNSTLDSIYIKAKLKPEEVKDKKLQFAMKISHKINELKKYKTPVDNNYLISEIIRLNSTTNDLVNELGLFIPTLHERSYRTFPVIIPSKNNYKSGELFTADVAVGNFGKMAWGKTLIEINGEPFDYSDGPVKFEETVPNQKGKRVLNLVYKEENMDTGKMEEKSSFAYEYEVN